MINEHQYTDGQIINREVLPAPSPNVKLELVTYISQGLRVKGYLVIPYASEPLPAMLYCRGGIRNVGMVRLQRIVPLAERGYVIFAPFYRGNEGGEGREDFGGEDRFDAHYGLSVLRSLPEVKEEPISIMGFSRGAIMAIHTAIECEEVGPIIIRGGVSDLFLTYEERIDLRRMLKRVVGHPHKQFEAYKFRSPIYRVNEINSPVLIVHGTEDENVSALHAQRLADALEKARKPYTLRLYEGYGHIFPPEKDQKVMDEIFTWLRNKK